MTASRVFQIVIFAICSQNVFAGTYLLGHKFPNSRKEGQTPVASVALTADEKSLGGYTELLEYSLPAPDQEDAGTCYYMSLTGIMEWWLAKLNPQLDRSSDGPLDLSERFSLNLAFATEDADAGVDEFQTDGIYFFNHKPFAVLNRDYRFTKGWFTEDKNGNIHKATKDIKGAEYGTSYNWVDETKQLKKGQFIQLPKFTRNIIFRAYGGDLWSVGKAPEDIVEKVKKALVENKAPVQVIYNHMGYWHTVNVLGFDDNRSTEGCQFVEENRQFFKGMKSPPDTYIPGPLRSVNSDDPPKYTEPPTDTTIDPHLKEKNKTLSANLEKAYKAGGGCNPNGVFYVRDSQYPDPEAADYIYNPEQYPNDKKPYNRRIILREYAWLKYLGNHAVQILATPR